MDYIGEIFQVAMLLVAVATSFVLKSQQTSRIEY